MTRSSLLPQYPITDIAKILRFPVRAPAQFETKLKKPSKAVVTSGFQFLLTAFSFQVAHKFFG